MTKNQKYQSTDFFRVEPLIASTITPTLHSPTPTLESEIDGRREGDGEREVTETIIVYVCVRVPVRLCLYVYSNPLFGGRERRFSDLPGYHWVVGRVVCFLKNEEGVR